MFTGNADAAVGASEQCTHRETKKVTPRGDLFFAFAFALNVPALSPQADLFVECHARRPGENGASGSEDD